MKQNIIGLSKQYAALLRKHLTQGAGAGLKPASSLGRRAVAMGLETLEMARMHEQALITLKLDDKSGQIKRAAVFFSEAITPIVETHRAARQSQSELSRLKEALNRRTKELAATNGLLKNGILRRKSVETAIKKSGEQYSKLLKDSLIVQQGLRELTHQVLRAQEEENRNFSRELQDEIVQTLVGINVRLLTLKKEAQRNSHGLKNEIASTQRVVLKSNGLVRRTVKKLAGK